MTEPRARLEAVLAGLGPVAVAVSGGVDSLTLAALAHRMAGDPSVGRSVPTLGSPASAALERSRNPHRDAMAQPSPEAIIRISDVPPLMVHAVSPAVPDEATERVRAEGAREGWTLRVIEAGEFADPAYRANPVNRCFFCKTNLYGAIRAVTDLPIVSGANLDDLGEYRPGLDAAREHGVRHPYVEAGIGKAAVRALARDLGLGAVAELPAAPCLSSRVETGLRIEPETLAFIHAVERLVGGALDGAPGPRRAVRCRVRAAGIVVELDPDSLAALAPSRVALSAAIAARAPARLAGQAIAFAPYRVGSAFLTGAGR